VLTATGVVDGIGKIQNPSTDHQNICRVLLCRRPLRLCHIWYNVTLLLNCVAQTNTNLSELEVNDSETPVSRTVYLISVAYSQSRCTFNYIFYVLLSNLYLYFIVIV